MLGLAITNIGGKLSYFYSSGFLPANFGLGAAWRIPFNFSNSITFAFDFNKLLVPSTDSTGKWRRISPIAGIFDSFTTLPGGFKEQIQEINISAGVEYWFRNLIALRAGYFYEDPNKGGRKYYTFGDGIRFKGLGLNIAYLLDDSAYYGTGGEGLDHTIHFTAAYHFAASKTKI